MQPPSLERQLLSSAPPRHLAASKVWLGSISRLHRQQLHTATWQQVEIPETSLSLGLHSPRGWEGCRSPAPSLPGSLLAVLLALPSGGGRAEHFLSCHYPAAQGRGWVLPLLA